MAISWSQLSNLLLYLSAFSSMTILSNAPRGISFIICAKKEIGMVFIFNGLSFFVLCGS